MWFEIAGTYQKEAPVRSTKFIYAPEAAARLGISIEWLRRLEREGRIPKARRMGNRRIYTEADISDLRRMLVHGGER